MKTLLRFNQAFAKGTFYYLFTVLFSIISSSEVYAQCVPVFSSAPQQITVSCDEPLPEFGQCQATSVCCPGNVVVTTLTSETGNVTENCLLSTAFGPGPDWAFWFPDFSGISISWNFVGDAHLEIYGDGTAHLWGVIANASNAQFKFSVDMWFKNARNWQEWSALGRSYKDDFGIAGSLYQTWQYYELAEGFANLTGMDALQGSYLQLHHKPANYFYGFQLGAAANNKNLNQGFSGWFTYNGLFNGQSVTGHGDINVDKNCQTIIDTCASTEFTKICRAQDACGNVAFQTSTIQVVDNEAPVVAPYEAILTVECQNAEGIYITATDNCSGVNIAYSDEVIVPGCGGSLIRTYTITDGCGNAVTVQQTIQLLSEGEPEFILFPDDITISCDQADDLQMPEVQWINGCGNTQLNISSQQIEGSCAGSYQIIYTYQLTDACDNLISQDWTVTVQDLTAPVLYNIPADVTSNCGEVVAATNVFALDNCDTEPLIALVAETIQGQCGFQFVRTWTATDACGNSTSATQVIMVQDNVNPVFEFVPQSVSVNCGEEVILEDAIAIDACSTLEVTFVDVPLASCAGGFIRTWTATDGCGLQTTAQASVTYIDEEAPVMIDFPEDIRVSCDNIPPLEQTPYTYADNCSAVVKTCYETVEPGDCPGNYILHRVFILTDECGNVSEWTYHVEVVDDQSPVLIGVPQNQTLSCGDQLADALVVANDNCDPNVSVSLNATTEQTECGYNFIRTWTATDACGNTAQATQVVSFTDNLPPVFTFVPEDINLACGGEAGFDDLVLAEATDDCSFVVVTYTDSPAGSNCGDGLIRTFTATDGCGNTTTAQQLIGFNDDEAPVFTFVPANAELPCGTNVELPMAVATDNCSGATITFTDTPAGGCAGSFLRVFTAMDACGNSTTASTLVTLVDDEAPFFIQVPEDVTVSCDNIPSIESAGITFGDNCGSVTADLFEDIFESDGCQGSYTITRLWLLSDECGNRTDFQWNITVTDNVAPTLIGVPQDQVVSCGDEVAEALVVAIDNCDTDVLVTLAAVTVPTECGYDFIRTWTATDACGNVAEATQVVSYTDNQPPVFTYVPEIISISCSEEFDPENLELAQATDDCSSVEISFIDEPLQGSCAAGFMRTFTATDGCGNTATAFQVVFFEDNEAPEFVFISEDIIAECGAPLEIPMAIAIDACSVVEMTFADTPLNTCSGGIVRTYTATDGCGNSSTASVQFIYIDFTPPSFTFIPSDEDITCGGDTQNSLNELAVAEDNCSAVTVTFEDVQNGEGCTGGFSRIWTATDACGNFAVAVTNYALNDDQAPEFVLFPEDVTVSGCLDIPSVESALVTYTDNCSNVTIQFAENQVALDCPSNFILERTWTISDACGNSTSQTWSVYVIDEQGPQFFGVPSNLTLACGDPVPDAFIFAVDNCTATDDIIITLHAKTTDDLCAPIFTRVWTAIDACGNSTEATQEILFIDNQPPVFAPFASVIELTCGESLDLEPLLATDNCSGVTYNTVTTPTSECTGSYIRVTTATDGCGNSSQATQVVSVQDNDAPVANFIPTDMEAVCGQVPVIPSDYVTFEDACSAVDITFFDDVIEGNCLGSYELTYMWIAQDACGNRTDVSFSIYVSAPAFEFESAPDDVVLSCSDSIPAPQYPVLAGECFANIPFILYEVTESLGCGGSYIIVRRFNAEADCERTVTHIQNILVLDTQAPTFLPFSPQISLPCAQSSGVFVSATDECSAVTITYTDQQIGAGCGGTIQRLYTATDACGNSAQATQFIQITDNESPVVTFFPQDLTVSCANVPPISAANILATDNCSNVFIESSEVIIPGNCPDRYTIERTFLIEDLCGNAEVRVWTIQVDDSSAPQILGVPADITIDCGDFVPTAFPIALDNCTSEPFLSLDAQTIFNDCGYEFIRTWTATDLCGNSSTSVFTVTVSDLFAPELSAYPEDVVLNCGESLPPIPEIFAEDNCAGLLEVSYEQVFMGTSTCSNVQRTWCATDCVGNTTCHTQHITFNPNSIPGLAASSTLELQRVGPNLFTIKSIIGSAGNWQISVFDLNGKLVTPLYQGTLDSGQVLTLPFDVTALSDGLYFVRLSGNDEMVTSKVSVIR